MIVLDIPDYVLMVDFGQNCDFHLALLLVLLTEMYLLHCGKHTIVDIECLVYPARPTSSNHLPYFPFLNALLTTDQVVLHDALLPLLQQQGDTLHYRDTFLTTSIGTVLQNLRLNLVVRLHEDRVHIGH